MIALAFLWLLFWTATAMAVQAQANCSTHERVSERLTDGWGEHVIAMALSGSAALVEIWANHETGTWSITVTVPDGQTCLVSSGEGFSMADRSPDDAT
jgi:protein-S-isoprenylcysteine O-methyltransferase Ste14